MRADGTVVVERIPKAGEAPKKIGVCDFLQFWLDVHDEHLFSGESLTPAGWPHIWRQVGERQPKPVGKPGPHTKFDEWDGKAASKMHERIPYPLLRELEANGVDTGKYQRPRKSIPQGPARKSELKKIVPTVNDIAMTGLGFFHMARGAFLGPGGSLRNPDTEPIDYDMDSTNTAEIAMVVEQVRAYSKRWRKKG